LAAPQFANIYKVNEYIFENERYENKRTRYTYAQEALFAFRSSLITSTMEGTPKSWKELLKAKPSFTHQNG